MRNSRLKYFLLALLFASLILNMVQYYLAQKPKINEDNLHGTYAYDDEELMLYMMVSGAYDTKQFILSSYEDLGISYLDKGVCKEITPNIYILSGAKKTYYLVRESAKFCTLIDYESDDLVKYRKVADDVVLGAIPKQLADELRTESEEHIIHSAS